MELELLFMLIGFGLASYSVVGNDSIQTLGTFLSSNEKKPWYILWLFAGGIMIVVLYFGWFKTGDPSFGRLERVAAPETFTWWYILPPLILLVITRLGVPVSTTFMILSVFSESLIVPMLSKSIMGYFVAFAFASVVYFIVAKLVEKHFIQSEITGRENAIWTVLQWCSTGFLWSQWLIQDLANIFVYLPRNLSLIEVSGAIAVMAGMLAYIFYQKGGAVQQVVTSKTNTTDIRSATIIDFLYAFTLLLFTTISKIPMSTTWVFVGLLAGREFMISNRLKDPTLQKVTQVVGMDLFKVFSGLMVSIGLVFIISYLKSRF